MIQPIYRFILLFAVFQSFVAYGQVTTINNEYSAKYVDVSNTKVCLIPPSSFEPTECYEGFEWVDMGANIKVVMVAAPIDKIIDQFDKNYLKGNRMAMISEESLKFNGHPAKLIYVQQQDKNIVFRKWILLAGNGYESFMTTGAFKAENEIQVGQAIKTSVLTSLYTP